MVLAECPGWVDHYKKLLITAMAIYIVITIWNVSSDAMYITLLPFVDKDKIDLAKKALEEKQLPFGITTLAFLALMFIYSCFHTWQIILGRKRKQAKSEMPNYVYEASAVRQRTVSCHVRVPEWMRNRGLTTVS